MSATGAWRPETVLRTRMTSMTATRVYRSSHCIESLTRSSGMGNMDREQLYDEAIDNMERTVHDLTGRMPAPSFVQKRGYRYAEKDTYRAIVQKMARIVSALRAARLLLAHGFIQEQASMCRIVD